VIVIRQNIGNRNPGNRPNTFANGSSKRKNDLRGWIMAKQKLKQKPKPRTKEDKNIEYLETRYMYEERQKTYLANEETNQIWDETDIPDVIAAWKKNWSISEIAEYLGASRHEMELLMADLIHQGKIQGNIHIFKPKRKGKPPMEFRIFDVEDAKIRTFKVKKELWICLKDLWKWIGKPEHSYRKVTEGWGPDHRAKYQLDTNSGRQYFIFINMSGLSRLCQYVEENQREMIEEFKKVVADGNI
jgi:hypothetical protein